MKSNVVAVERSEVKAKVVGMVQKETRVKPWQVPCKVPFGSMLRKELSKRLIPVNRAGR